MLLLPYIARLNVCVLAADESFRCRIVCCIAQGDKDVAPANNNWQEQEQEHYWRLSATCYNSKHAASLADAHLHFSRTVVSACEGERSLAYTASSFCSALALEYRSVS
jgi:hypothetical protein